MNVEYIINPDTGIIRLSFKDDMLSTLSKLKGDIFKDVIVDALSRNKKLAITGSLGLRLLGLENSGDIGDFDLNIVYPIDMEEYRELGSRYGLVNVAEDDKFDPGTKWWSWKKEGVTIEVFNTERAIYTTIYRIYWKEREIAVVKPSIVWSYRMRHAIDNRKKHVDKLIDLCMEPGPLIRTIEIQQILNVMVAKSGAHNAEVLKNKDTLDRVRNYITSEDIKNPSYFDGIFAMTIPKGMLHLRDRIEQG